jgi:hypothetical protein
MFHERLIGGAGGHAAIAKIGLRDDGLDHMQQGEAGVDIPGKRCGVMESVF